MCSQLERRDQVYRTTEDLIDRFSESRSAYLVQFQQVRAQLIGVDRTALLGAILPAVIAFKKWLQSRGAWDAITKHQGAADMRKLVCQGKITGQLFLVPGNQISRLRVMVLTVVHTRRAPHARPVVLPIVLLASSEKFFYPGGREAYPLGS
jgi:hypothetical protein